MPEMKLEFVAFKQEILLCLPIGQVIESIMGRSSVRLSLLSSENVAQIVVIVQLYASSGKYISP